MQGNQMANLYFRLMTSVWSSEKVIKLVGSISAWVSTSCSSFAASSLYLFVEEIRSQMTPEQG